MILRVFGLGSRSTRTATIVSNHRVAIAGGQTGMVTALQRAGSGLNVNLHFHTLVLDGVFTEAPGARWRFIRRDGRFVRHWFLTQVDPNKCAQGRRVVERLLHHRSGHLQL